MTSLRFILRLQFEPQNLHADGQRALLSPKASVVMYKRPFHNGSLNSEMPWDSYNAFLHYGNASGLQR